MVYILLGSLLSLLAFLSTQKVDKKKRTFKNWGAGDEKANIS